MSLLGRLRPEIRALRAYAVDRVEGARLNNNESPLPPPDLPGALNRYPDEPRALHERMAVWYGATPGQVLATRGSDDAIDALIRAFCRPQRDAVLIAPPTFSMYAQFAVAQGARVIEMPSRENFEFPVEAVAAFKNENLKIVFVCTPNNPTGTAMPLADIDALCRAFAGRALVCIDEAYAEFSAQPSATRLLACHENLAVLRSLSKGLALAGARVGALLATPALLKEVRKLLPPYLLPQPSVDAAMTVLSDGALALLAARNRRLVEARDRLARELVRLSLVKWVYPSEGNFLLTAFHDAEAAQAALANAGLRVRAFGAPRLADCLRISIGLDLDNRRVVAALETVHA